MIAAVCETAGQLAYVDRLQHQFFRVYALNLYCYQEFFLKEKLAKKQYVFIGIIIVAILILTVLEGEQHDSG